MAVKKLVWEVIGEQTIHCTGCESAIRRGLSQLQGDASRRDPGAHAI